ncbi:MAG: hypothetical protein JSS86_22040, partial [Cyanobacteria bacterium SZAS LIN-2]|nr:hypothetical protein [Cyanobacteria bacterium SZAS LIN-2]
MTDSAGRKQVSDSQSHNRGSSDVPPSGNLNSVEILHDTKPQVYIGDATMDKDGTINLNLRRTADGINTSGQIKYRPGTKDYDLVFCHLGGIKPGEVKLVKPFEDKE